MTIDVFSPASLKRVVADLRDSPQVGTFLIRRYFSEVSVSTQEAVYFDVLTGKPRLAPFVTPLVEGMVVESRGYVTKSFTPAYIKDKRVFEDGKVIRRRVGQPIGVPEDPMARRAADVRAESEDQIAMVNRRMEWMAASALHSGSITVSGEKYPTTVVNFGRDAALTVSLSGTARWNDSAPAPLDNLEDWAGLIRDKSGASPTDVIMSSTAWSSFRKSADVKALLAAGKFSDKTNIDLGPSSRPFGGASDKGQVGDFNIFIYSDSYVDDNGVTQKYLPDDYIWMVAGQQLEGVQHFGGIKDEKAGFQATDYFQKSWTQDDPAVRFLMLQSAPLVVPYRINACLRAKVQ